LSNAFQEIFDPKIIFFAQASQLVAKNWLGYNHPCQHGFHFRSWSVTDEQFVSGAREQSTGDRCDPEKP